MIIREMTERDVPAVAEIESLSFSSPWTEDNLKESLSCDFNCFYISEKENKITGYIGITIAADECYILNVAVHPDHRGQGIGKTLVEKVLSFAKDKSLAFVSLEVRPSNTPAINLYTSLGFEKAGERRDFYTNPKENALILTKFFNQSRILP